MSERPISWKVYGAVAIAILCGLAFRLIFPFDIEYKADEIWTFEHVMDMLAGKPWPLVGMGTSFGPPNPGLSLWFFAGLAWLSGASTPPALSQAVQILNDAAIISLVAFILISVPKERREVWLWGVALWAVNPIAVAYERKIWPPSVFPAFTVAFIVAWWYRRNFWAALIWGMLGALMAQLHIGAAFLALAVAGWTAFADRRDASWIGWLIGSIIGSLPALPWLMQVMGSVGSHSHLGPPVPIYFLRWISQPFGLYVHVFNGPEFLQFLFSPNIGDVHTFLVLLFHAGLVALWLWIGLRTVQAITRQNWPSRRLLLGLDREWLLVNASLWGYGGLMTALTVIGVSTARNYMIVIAPKMALWVALLIHDWVAPGDPRLFRKLMVAICVCQIFISAAFLSFVHERQVFEGNYGPTWRSQQK